MAPQFYNPFAGIDLFVPSDQHDDYQRFCQSPGGALVDQSPFPRMVDLWFAGVCLSVRLQRRPVEISVQDSVKIIDGSIFDRDSWRVQALMLLAIAQEQRVEVIGDPRRVIAIANGMAAAGVPDICELLRNGKQDPIWNLSEGLVALMHGEL